MDGIFKLVTKLEVQKENRKAQEYASVVCFLIFLGLKFNESYELPPRKIHITHIQIVAVSWNSKVQKKPMVDC